MSLYYEGADGIRGLACLIVLLVHASAIFFPGTFSYLYGAGKIGVWLFFVLSAFLLTSKLLKNGFTFFEISKYAIGRFLRIIPLFFTAIIIYWKFHLFGLNTTDDFMSAILMTKSYGHFWTIPVEFKFYFLLPFIAICMSSGYKKLGAKWISALTIFAIAIHQSVWGYWNNPTSDAQLVWYIPTFMIGCLGATIISDARRYITPHMASAVGLLVITISVLMTPGARNYIFGAPLDAWTVNKYLHFSLLWLAFVLFLADGKGWIGTILKTRPMRLIGAWSYSIYLMHMLFYIKLAEYQTNNYQIAAIGIILAIACGAAMHYFIEIPLERLRYNLQLSIKKYIPAN